MAAPIAVVGGGLAGLTAALDLAEAGRAVSLFERRPFAGGKAYSFTDPAHGVTLDNGQHITMRCCTAFQALLERLGRTDLVRYQDGLEVAVVDPTVQRGSGRQVSVLRASKPHAPQRFGLPSFPQWTALPAPFHLAPSALNYEHLTLLEKTNLARAFAPIRKLTEAERARLDRQSFADWLRAHGQSERVIERFWDLIILPTCNDRSAHVSAMQALHVFQVGFSQDPRAADIGLFTGGLGEVAQAAAARLEELGGTIEFSAAVDAVGLAQAAAVSVQTRSGSHAVSGVVLALPPRQAFDVLPPAWRRREPFWRLAMHRTSPIVNVHQQWDRPVLTRDFVGVLDPDAQFIFNRSQTHAWPTPPHWISVSLSGAHELLPLPQAEIAERVERAVRRALPRAAAAELLAVRVVKEADATFRPFPGAHAHRLRPRTSIRNLTLAGAWTDTGWPATLESAVRSGRAAARTLLEQLEQDPP